MSIKIRTAEGVLVTDKLHGKEMTLEQAQASVVERNERAEAMGIKARYVVDEG